MLDDINTDSSNSQNVLYDIFNKNCKTELLDKFCVNLVQLGLGNAYDDLCRKLKDLFDDETNGEKYFNNLINILEILDWVQTHYSGFNHNYFSKLWDKFKSQDKISEFINLVKNFETTDSEYMFVVKDKNGNEFKTPGLQITTSQVLFDNNEIMIASDINNTCATGSTIKEQFQKWSHDPYLIQKDYEQARLTNKLTVNDKLNLDIFGKKSGSREFLLALKKIKDYDEWENQIKQDYKLELNDLKNLVDKIANYHIYNFARLLSKPEDDKILFYNVPIRGKGNGDFKDIDSEEFELFSIFDKNSMFKLNRYHIGKSDNRISNGNKYGANFLLDQVSCGNNPNQEGYEAESSKLTDLGKNITKTGLKWFLDEKEYEINENLNGVISVTKKQPKKDINIINTSDNLLSEEKKISDQTVFNQINTVEKNIDDEMGDYANKFINDISSLFKIYFEQNQMLENKNIEINTDNNALNNNIRVDQKINDEVNKFINSFCEVYDTGILNLFDGPINMKDQCNFTYLIKKVIGPVIIDYFRSLDDNYRQQLAFGTRSVIATIENKFGKELLNPEKIRDRLVREIYYNESNWKNPMKYDSNMNKFVEDDFKFDFDAAGLTAYETAKLLNDNFNKFKEKVSNVFKNVLPDNKDEFEKSFDDVDCTEFISFLKQNMEIDVNKEFLKKAISALFYTWVESVRGNDDNGSAEKVAERLEKMRQTFFDDYSGTNFIHEIKLYTSSMIDKGEKPLPDAFYWYNSDKMKIGDEDSVAYRFTVVNYIQAFYYAMLAVKRKKCKNMGWRSHRKFNKNIEETRRILQTGTEDERDQIFNRMRQIRDQKYENNIWGLPLAFLDILLDGVSIDLSLEEKIEICTFARNYVDHELDNPTKQHVTKSNFMEIDKENNCYLKSNGQIVLPLANLFAPGAIDEFLSKIICDQVWEMSFCNTCCDALFDSWHYFDQNNIFIKLLAKALFIMLFTCFSLIIGIVLLIAYIVYTKNLKSKLNELANDPTFNKLRQAEINGREEYNKLQNFRQDTKKEKPPTIIENGKQNINLNIDMNQKLNIIDNINDKDNINNNLIDNNIINTNSNQIDDLFN